ncbi:hypothetical protein ACS0TY_010161 [Phlomoides rotata]
MNRGDSGVAGDGGRGRLHGGSLASPPPVPHQRTVSCWSLSPPSSYETATTGMLLISELIW